MEFEKREPQKIVQRRRPETKEVETRPLNSKFKIELTVTRKLGPRGIIQKEFREIRVKNIMNGHY